MSEKGILETMSKQIRVMYIKGVLKTFNMKL